MKQLLTRIESLETTVQMVVDRIVSLKEENQILSQENNRLHKELDQLRRRREVGSSADGSYVRKEIDSSESDINVGQLRDELDRCIVEIEDCLGQM